MTIVNQISCHSYIFYILSIVLLINKQEKSCLAMSFWLLHYSLKTFKAPLLWYCHLKKIEITNAAEIDIMQYQLNFSWIEKSNITFWWKPEPFLYLSNKKERLSFSAFLSHVNIPHYVSNALDCQIIWK